MPTELDTALVVADVYANALLELANERRVAQVNALDVEGRRTHQAEIPAFGPAEKHVGPPDVGQARRRRERHEPPV